MNDRPCEPRHFYGGKRTEISGDRFLGLQLIQEHKVSKSRLLYVGGTNDDRYANLTKNLGVKLTLSVI